MLQVLACDANTTGLQMHTITDIRIPIWNIMGGSLQIRCHNLGWSLSGMRASRAPISFS